MLLVLEGPDLGGKSTVARSIAAHCGLEPIHYGGKITSITDMVMRVASYPEHGIIDRHTMISEYVYGTSIPERVPLITKNALFAALSCHPNMTILYCSPPFEFVEQQLHFLRLNATKRYKTRDHVEAVVANYRRIYSTYAELMWELSAIVRVIHIDFRNNDHIKHTQEIVDEHFRH